MADAPHMPATAGPGGLLAAAPADTAPEARTDTQLVRAYNAGDARAFAHIVRRHMPRLKRIARRYAANEHDAQDILQDALFKASRNLHAFRNEASLSTWLHRLVMNSGNDYVRHHKRTTHMSLDDTDKINHDANPLLAHDPTANLERVIVLHQALHRLPAAQRRALLLIDVAGLTVERAAQEMGVRPGTIKSRRNRAREALGRQLAPGRTARTRAQE